jgi:1,4-alpha-glucan branching enzyme
VLDRLERTESVAAVDPLVAATRIPRIPTGRLHPCSWGEGGFAAVWLDPSNDWIYRHLLRAAERMHALAAGGDRGDALRARALRQAGRELLLAQASDWAFIMKTGTLVPYAVQRTEVHLARFDRLAAQLDAGDLNAVSLSEMESAYPLFSELDPGLFA